MPLSIKDVRSSAQKFSQRASQSSNEFRQGVSESTNQAENAIAAEDRYRQGLQDSFQRNARVRGLERSGTETWRRRTLDLGSGRYSQGVQASENLYRDRVQPYFDRIASLDLSPRGPKGSPENYQRVQEVGQALHELKTQQS